MREVFKSTGSLLPKILLTYTYVRSCLWHYFYSWKNGKQ